MNIIKTSILLTSLYVSYFFFFIFTSRPLTIRKHFLIIAEKAVCEYCKWTGPTWCSKLFPVWRHLPGLYAIQRSLLWLGWHPLHPWCKVRLYVPADLWTITVDPTIKRHTLKFYLIVNKPKLCIVIVPHHIQGLTVVLNAIHSLYINWNIKLPIS